jgi:predicted PurR-regulated permease PerM
MHHNKPLLERLSRKTKKRILLVIVVLVFAVMLIPAYVYLT